MNILQKHMRGAALTLHPGKFVSQALVLCVALLLSGCGSMMGLPSHGGGKRFAIEQELVAASARGALKQIDLAGIKGKKVNIYLNAVGDIGAGNLTGGRFSVVSELRGSYTGSGGISTNDALQYKGAGDYRSSETLFGASDLQYFQALLHTYLFLKGVQIVPPSEAEIDVHVTLDVFGTVRSRVEWFLANNEILQARTALEILAVERAGGQVVMPPQAVGAEAEYNEQYLLWAGPVSAQKFMKKKEPLLADFTDLPEHGLLKTVKREEPVPYPFSRQREHRQQDVETAGE